MKKLETAIIQSNTSIANGIYKMVLVAPKIVAEVQNPGQFINVYPKEKHTLLPRPISICEIDRETQTLTIVYAVVGDGTAQFSNMLEGEEVKIGGPVGNGFTPLQGEKEHVLVGGGIGVPPLLELAKRLKGKLTVILGFRDEPILVEEFEKLGATVYVATDSGRVGHKGNVVDILNEKNIGGDMFYSCGPKPMLQALASWCRERNLSVQVSLEERMGCGIGVCVGCVCKIKVKDQEQGWTYKKVCTDGPVFMGSEVLWDE